MKMHKILLGCVVCIALLWASIFLFVQYTADTFIQKFSVDEVRISYDKLYVKFGIKHPLTIIIKNIKAVSDGVAFYTHLHLYPSFSHMIVKMNLSVNNKDDNCSVPIIVTAKKSQNKNFYLATFDIDNAAFSINGSNILVDGGIEFYPDRLPLGGYNISISDTQKLLESTLLKQYPNILHKTQKILSSIDGQSPKCIPIIDQSNTRSANVEERKPILNRCAPEIIPRDAVGDRYRIGIRLDYTETGMQLDGIPVENL